MAALETLFWLCFLLSLHPYGIYPLLVYDVWQLRRRVPLSGHHEPTVTIIVPARNEQTVIARRIENLLELDYPPDKLQILIVSDASTDATNDIAEDYAARGKIEFLPLLDRRGKTGAQNEAIRRARGEIIVFSDASTLFRPDGLRCILRPLSNPTVGCVGGWILLTTTGDFTGIPRLGAYIRFEQALRKAEGEIWTTSGLNGCFYAIRRELARPMNEQTQIDDLVNGLRTMAAGKRVVYEPEALAAEAIEIESGAGFQRRVRSSLGGLSTLFSMPRLLNPLRHPFIAFQLFSHKLLRFLLIPLLILTYALNIPLLTQGSAYKTIFALQTLAWIAVALGAIHQSTRKLGKPGAACSVLFSFIQQHAASAVALWKYLRHHPGATRWDTPPPRK